MVVTGIHPTPYTLAYAAKISGCPESWLKQLSQRAVYVHSTALAGKDHTCIDCHKGIAHRLPNMEGIEMLYGAPLEQISSNE